MEDLTETGIQNTLAELQQEYGPAGMYIHLDPPGTTARIILGSREYNRPHHFPGGEIPDEKPDRDVAVELRGICHRNPYGR